MRRALILLALLMAPSAHAASKVASAGLCADQVVLPLVERDRVAGVSFQATDTTVSLVADQAKGLPVVAPSAEALILAGADTVVLNTFGDGKTKALLEKLGVTVLRVPYDARLAGIPQSLRHLGKDMGAAARAEALATNFESRMDRLRAARPGTSVLAAYYRPDGGSAGLETYVAESMQAAGYRSLASHLGIKGWRRLELEDLILNPPDAFVTSFFERDENAVRRSFGRHPVLRRMLATAPVVQVPGRMWGCGGWPVAVAAEHMAERRP